jgi:hypothetical protein
LPDQPSSYYGAPLTTAWSCMACLALVCVYWVVQEELAARNYEEGWSQIDGKEQAMADDGGSRIERNAEGWGGFWKKLTEVWWAFGGFEKRRSGGSEDEKEDNKLGCRSEGCEWSEKNGQTVAR